MLASLCWPVSGLGYVGMICALVGAASQAMHGFERNFHAIVGDRVFSLLEPFDKKTKGQIGSTRIVVLMWLAVSIACLAGDLNYLVVIVAILYLMVYASLNGACFLLSVTKSPSFRPHFKYFRFVAIILMYMCQLLC